MPRRCTRRNPPVLRGAAEAGAPGAGASEPGHEKPKDNVVDAEFIDVDDKK